MEELPDFEDAYTMDARVMEQVVIFQRYLLFVAHFIALAILVLSTFLVSHIHAVIAGSAVVCLICWLGQRVHARQHPTLTFCNTLNMYTVIVINPRLPAPGVSYGYRFGFSQSELNHLRSSDSVISELLSRPSKDAYASSLKSARGAPDASNVASVSERSETWSRRFFSSMYGSSSIDIQDALHSAMPEKLEEWFAWHKVHAGAATKVSLFAQLATNMLRSNSPVDRAYVNSHVVEAAGSAGCLTEAWVSAYRFAWIDLSAGQFTWGTGTGAKGADSFPHVAPDFFSRGPSHHLDFEASVTPPTPPPPTLFLPPPPPLPNLVPLCFFLLNLV
jgi:hypothetical protein